jgi:hypothetical protein
LNIDAWVIAKTAIIITGKIKVVYQKVFFLRLRRTSKPITSLSLDITSSLVFIQFKENVVKTWTTHFKRREMQILLVS